MSSRGTPKLTVRVPVAEQDDGRWAADILDTTVSERLRAELVRMVDEAERVSGEQRPSLR